MSGTNRTIDPILGGPTIILVEPQLGENIGATARAMLNFGLVDLRLVRPRDGWPNDRAISSASGADQVMESVQVFDTTAVAIGDLNHVLAATARTRAITKDIIGPRQAAQDCRKRMASGAKVGILFGPERAGLHNDDLALSDTIIAIATNPAFASLNLSQSVLLVAYEWFAAGKAGTELAPMDGAEEQATKEDLVAFFEAFEKELDTGGFLKPPEKRPAMIRTLRNLFQKARLTDQEVRSLRGVVVALTRLRGPPR
jgi:tRNA/rRNA methyltransferase